MPKKNPHRGLAEKAIRRGRQRCVIYTRISRDDTELGKANERQEEVCRKKADFKGYDVVAVVDDVYVSAFDGKDREGWMKVLDMIRRGEVDVVLAYHIDRITRSMKDLEELIDLCLEHGVGVDTATGDIELTTDVGRMVARILAAVARAEVERKSERQRLAYEQRAKEGKPHSVQTFGYLPGNLDEDSHQAESLRAAAEAIINGEVSLADIARHWRDTYGPRCERRCKIKHEADGSPHRHRRPPASPQAVRYALLNPRYAGIRYYYDEQVGQGVWAPIFDMDTHLALKARLSESIKNHWGQARSGRRPSTLLGGIAVCDACSQPSKATKAHGNAIYGCRGGNHINTVREQADEIVAAKMVARLSRPDVLQKVVDAEGTPSKEAHDAAEKIVALKARKNGLAEDYAEGLIDRDQMRAGTTKINSEIADLQRLVRSAAAPTKKFAVGTAQFAEAWENATLDEKRRLIELYADVTLVPRGKGNRRKEARIEEQVLVSFPG